MKWNIGPTPPGFRSPSTSQINPPVNTRIQELPLKELSWENFEKLCLSLIEEEDEVEHCQFYGTHGQDQAGIDIYAKKRSEKKYSVYQCKRVRKFGPSDIKKAVTIFLQGEWRDKSNKFILCSSEGFNSRPRADEVEAQRSILEKEGIKFETWDKFKLSSKLKQYPKIVDDFFGREWVKLFCGSEAADMLGERLELNEVIELRNDLRNFYLQMFKRHDRFPFHTTINTISLKNRYVFPDIDDVKIAEQTTENYNPQKHETTIRNNLSTMNQRNMKIRKHYSTLEYQQRQGFEKWLYMSDHSIVLGGPGSGKSTLLRFIAMDLLSDHPQLNLLENKWGQFIPLWIPFSSWTKKISDDSDKYSLKKFINSWLANWDMEKLQPVIERALDDKKVLLLVDGLDEWINEDAAKSALNRLINFINSHNIPAIVSSRPHSFERLGIQEIEWQTGSISDFSIEQQVQLSKIWFKHLLIDKIEDLDEEKLNLKIKFETERLLNELHNSPELKELAKIPLLLCLMIYHKYKGYNLPQSRFKAYDSLITHLINEHPQMRREAGDIINPSKHDVNEIRLILEYLAYNIQEHHSNGIIEYSKALSVLKDFLENDKEFKFTSYNANKFSKKILKLNEEDFGLIVKQSPNEIGFLHRIFQEYLAGNYISRKNQNKQKLILKTYCANSQWREVVLSFFNIISGSGNLENLIKYIRSISKETNKFNQYSIELILYEVAFGNFNCPVQLSKDLALEAFEKVEFGSWMPQRERILHLILNGLISESIQEIVKLKLKQWFPDKFGWRSFVYNGMNNWPKTSEVVDCLWKGIHDDNFDNRRAAANALAVIAKDDQKIGNNVAFLAKTAVDPGVRAAMIYSLFKGWDSLEGLITILKNASNSKSPEIRLMAILGKVNKKIHTIQDQDELIKLSCERTLSESILKEDCAKCFLKGWPKSNRIKKLCLKSLRHELPWEERLNHDISLHIITEGYPQDEEVAQFFIEKFRTGDDPFIGSRLTMRNLESVLAKNFKNHPQLVEAVDKWVEDPKRKGMAISEISSLASIGCTDKIKGNLLNAVDKNYYESRWAANSLIENWGMEDTEVCEKLTSFVVSSNEKASLMGEVIPKIIENRVVSRKTLLELLKDVNHSHHHFVLFGLKDLKDGEDDKEVVNIVLDKFPKINEVLVHTLIENYPSNQRVKELAMQELSKINNNFDNTGIIAKNYKDDVTIRKKIIDMICPLPSHLREIIIKFLGDSGNRDEFTKSMLSLYDYEYDGRVKMQASINYFNLLKFSDADITQDLDYLDHTIDAMGMNFENRRKAAFCGLVILKQLKKYRDKISFSALDHYGLNIPFFRLILENLEYINETLGDEFWHDSSRGITNSLYKREEFYLLADEFPVQRDKAINFIKDCEKDNGGFLINIMNFLSRNCPKSRLLLDYCIKTFQDKSNSYGSLRDIIIATKILGDHFGGDDKILKYIISELPVGHSKGILILLLCEGWPDNEELISIFNEFKEGKIKPGLFASFKLVCQKGETERVFNGFSSLFSDYSIENEPSWIIREYKRPLIHRIQNDKKFLNMLITSLHKNPCFSFKSTIPRLISASGKMTPKLREWCIEELNHQLNPKNSPEIGMDLVSGELRPVAHSLLDIL